MLLRTDVIAALTVMAGIGLAMNSGEVRSIDSTDAITDSHRAVSFETEVLPILEKHCTECHSDENAELGLKLDTYEGLMGGSDYGTVVEAGRRRQPSHRHDRVRRYA